MTFAGLIFIGLLFGVILGASVVGFIVVRAGGPLRESLFGNEAHKPAFAGPPPPAELTPEADKRLKALTEELRIANKLLDQNRVEREEQDKAVKGAVAGVESIRGQLADRNLRVVSLEASLRQAELRIDELLGQLSDRSEHLATVTLQLTDARMELDVHESGSTVTSVQITQLQRERDQLAALVEQLQPRRAASRPFS
jgi:chromosome segregation ATPase